MNITVFWNDFNVLVAVFADSNLPNRPTYGEFKRVLLNIGFVAVDGDDYAVRPGEELARTNDTLFRYNPDQLPFNHIVTVNTHRSWSATLTANWGLTLANFYHPPPFM